MTPGELSARSRRPTPPATPSAEGLAPTASRWPPSRFRHTAALQRCDAHCAGITPLLETTYARYQPPSRPARGARQYSAPQAPDTLVLDSATSQQCGQVQMAPTTFSKLCARFQRPTARPQRSALVWGCQPAPGLPTPSLSTLLSGRDAFTLS
ncbi:uncharacterized protein TRAVEDRAFT_32451 [Trametes versicolor FP-101664 SS1]|uniref:Uncharacterized protein n=1 Tax=Trametes versicolor (strain FP-101664) TaxID=717944 RepID=R7S787_TRAVS|nr:uncharacterized protein TRAVEDRAFT_32451 [Trametes versicolor FP-101664 SS1]EIW51470.1 hypothetical protein TRAVEDRAFT_32451 [Trametes versicolor FP-101664 SS1]